MAAPRRVIELAFTEQELIDLERISRSRTEAASREATSQARWRMTTGVRVATEQDY